MTYIALARKWRPRTFENFLGQDHVKKILVNSLQQNRIHHAYLFTGTRGVGKTSVARLFAKSLNCEQQITASPCLQCSNCIAIEHGQFLDLVEVDGASKTRVEDTRDLLENIQYTPTVGRFKIYLIDEVHMLSNHSFNALLKTLEEPPEHVKFLLATTDPQKLPITVLSRCLQLNLKPISAEVICDHMQSIMAAEKIPYEKEALALIAKAARGSIRDALSLLDQAIISCEEKLTTQLIKDLLGYSQQDFALKIIFALARLDSQELLNISQQINIEGGHFQFVLTELIQYFHQISIYQNFKDSQNIDRFDSIKTAAQQLAPEDVHLFYQIALKGQEDLFLAPSTAIAFDMLLLRMYTFKPMQTPMRPSLAFEHALYSEGDEDSCEQVKVGDCVRDNAEEIILDEEVGIRNDAAAIPDNVVENKDEGIQKEFSWEDMLPRLNLTGLTLSAAENAAFLEKIANNVTLQVNKGHSSLFNPAVIKRMEEALSTYFSESIKLHLKNTDGVVSTPATKKQGAASEDKHRAEIALENDPVFQRLNQEFSAELVKNSITPIKDKL